MISGSYRCQGEDDMELVIHPPAGLWSTRDLEQISDGGLRMEIHNGNLVVQPLAGLWHSRMSRRITNALEKAGHVAEIRVGVRRTDHDFRVADVAVFTTEPPDPHCWQWTPEQLRIVIEVVSAASTDADYFDKPRFYARAGIAEFWRVEQSEDETDGVIFQYKLARTADGQPAGYLESGMTTVSALEQGL